MTRLRKWASPIALGTVALTGALAMYFNVAFAERIAVSTWTFSKDLLIILPLTFVLAGLFEVWVKREHVERHLGVEAGWRGIVWAILLGGTVVGPMLTALPIAAALHKKGASLTVCLAYIGSASVCRIPMTLFEISFLGARFTLVRYGIAIPLIAISSVLLGKWLERRPFHFGKVKHDS
ncbi:MAG: permease [Deltaproteobacteria bacterium]|nr:permease [Deltaproteobacteria bacterium]